MKKNWKTTVTGVLTALPHILKFFGVNVPDEVINGITGLGLGLMGWLAADSTPTSPVV